MGFERVAILSIGEMGYHWARLLAGAGIDTLTCLRGRSERTRKRAENARTRAVSMEEIALQADLVVSLVVPSAAKRVAIRLVRSLSDTGRRDLVYLDANAVSPLAAREMADRLSRAGATFVDGSIIGSAAKIGEGTMIYLSGSHAEKLRPLERCGFSLRVLSPEIGHASAFKILYAGLTKGLQGLFTELLLGAQKLQLLDEILRRYDETYPGLTAKVGGGIAALETHAGRRAEEMTELNRTLRYYGLRTVMAPATGRLLREISRLKRPAAAANAGRESDWRQTLERFVDQGLLETAFTPEVKGR